MGTFSGFEHAAIAAHDSRELVDWYVKVFDLKVVYDNSKTPPTCLLSAPDGTVLEIMPAAYEDRTVYEQYAPGFRHVAITVPDFDAAVNRLRKHGIEAFFDFRTSDASKLIFFRDPEGNVLHLIWRATPLIQDRA